MFIFKFYVLLSCFLNIYLKCYEIDSNKISTANPKSKTVVQALLLPKRNLGLWKENHGLDLEVKDLQKITEKPKTIEKYKVPNDKKSIVLFNPQVTHSDGFK